MTIFKTIFNFFAKYFKTYKIFKPSDAVIYQYYNPTDDIQTGILFGVSDGVSENQPNKNVEVVDIANIKWEDLKIKGNPIIHNIRVHSQELKQQYITSKFDVVKNFKSDYTWVETMYPICFLTHVDLYQWQSDIIDMKFGDGIEITENDYIKFELKPKTRLVISIRFKDYKKINYFEYKRFKKAKRLDNRDVIIMSNQVKKGFSIFNIFKK